ncbi:27682_t:CDS:2, partial [Racocetra persica]
SLVSTSRSNPHTLPTVVPSADDKFSNNSDLPKILPPVIGGSLEETAVNLDEQEANEVIRKTATHLPSKEEAQE